MQQHEERNSMLDDGITLADYWSVLRRRKTMMISLCLVSVLATMMISLLLPKYYQSQATILAIAPDSGGLGAALSASPLLAGVLTGAVGGSPTPEDRLLVFLKSRTIAEMVIKRFDLVRIFNERKWDPVKGDWKDTQHPPLLEETVHYLGKKVASFKKSKEGAIAVTVEWKDPKLAAEIANYYVVALAEIMKIKSVNTTVQIVDPAVPAEKKSRPLIAMNMMVAGIVSLLIGVILAFLLEEHPKSKRTFE